MQVQFTAETFVTLSFTISIITTNTLVLLIVAWTRSFRNINKIFFCSLTLADLCMGVFITPFAIFSSFRDRWIENDEKFCHIEAYLLAIFFIAGLYSLCWTNVDHYVAIRNPQRHKTAMTPARSLCWVIFSWIAAISFCSPPLFSFERARYYTEVYICSIDTGPHKPYFVTAGILVLIPAILVLTVTNAYLFTSSFRKKREMFQTVLLDVSSRPTNYNISLVASLVCFLSWLPWCILQVYGLMMDEQTVYPHQLHFYFLWLGIGNSFYKFFIYLVMSQEFRKGLCQLCGRDCTCPDCIQTSDRLSINIPTSNGNK